MTFHEYWMPLRGLGGLTRMNPEGALFVERVPALGRCPQCGAETEPEFPLLLCGRCGAPGVELAGGRDLVLKSVEMEVPEAPGSGKPDAE